MEKVQKILVKTSSPYPYTAAMRNFIATSSDYTIRQVEWQRSPVKCYCALHVFRRGTRPTVKPLFCVEDTGKKKETFEALYRKVYDFLEDLGFVVQGDIVVEEEQAEQASKEENVIITAPEGERGVDQVEITRKYLEEWSNSEKFYDFSGGDSAIMNRWFPLDSVRIATSMKKETNGGLVTSWKIPEALIKGHFDAINILPLRSFMLGRLDLEFKMILQANPFQACCVMLGTIPNPMGLDPKTVNIKGLKNDSTGVSLKTYPYYYMKGSNFSYLDFQTSIQRPHVIVDVNTGGEAVLVVKQKFHKTLLRTLDFSFAEELNPGLRGSWTSTLTLHLLSNLRVGSGADQEFYVRVFYRFVNAKVTAMTNAVTETSPVLSQGPLMVYDEFTKFFKADEPYKKSKRKMDLDEVKRYLVQGPTMSFLRTGVDVASTAITAVEQIGTQARKGFVTRQRDKPRDPVTIVQTVPRPRRAFPNGSGIDDSLVLAMHWDQVVEFFESFPEEPRNFKQLTSILGYHGRFLWSKSNSPGTQLYEWNVSPVFVDGNWSLDSNQLRSPLAVSSSTFTNYWGTMEMMFQFVKTNFHKGALEISIQFGKAVKGNSLESSYVKVVTVQDNSAFSVTVPYIYDTAVRAISGTNVPMYLPNISNPVAQQFYRSCYLTVKVLNELTAPVSVTNEIEVLLWIKGGRDFGLNVVRPTNTLSFVDTPIADMLLPPQNVRKIMRSNNAQPQLLYNMVDASIARTSTDFYVVQGDDFQQGLYVENKINVVNHGDFKTILKMPVKIFNQFPYVSRTKLKYISEGKEVEYSMRNYFCLPVAPLSASLVHYLNNQYFHAKANVEKNAQSVFGATFLQQSPQFLVNSMFGMFRGSMTYTVVVNTLNPVYVAYMPNDYSLRKLIAPLSEPPLFSSGNYAAQARDTVIGFGEDDVVDLAQLGLYNTMIIPTVNPTERVEIPFSHSVNWLLMNRLLSFKGESEGLRTLRENSEWFTGHFVLWSAQDFTFDLYVNCSDDLELGGFLGVRGVTNPWGAIASLTDNWRVQSDFSLKEVALNGWNSVDKGLKKTAVASLIGAMHGSIPQLLKPISLGAMTFFALGGINEIISFRNGLQMVKEQSGSVASSITSEGARVLLGVIREAFPMVVVNNVMMDNFWFAAQHVVHTVISNNWKSAAFGFFCMMVKLEIFSLSDWASLKESIVAIFRTTGTEFVVQAEANETWSACMEVLVTIFCAKMQIKNVGGIRKTLSEVFQWQNYRIFSGINSITQLVRNLIKAINTIFSYLTEQKDPRIKLQKLLSAQGDEVGNFVDEATLYLNYMNDMECRRKETRVRFLTTIVKAYKLKAVLIELCNPSLTQQLLTLCNDVIKKASQQRYLFKCDLVKTEPFVLCVEGATAVGKSFAAYDLAVEGLSAINVKGNVDCLFTVSPGVKYWNGYSDQPVVWYDDWCNLMDDETIKDHLSQLYALKTSAPYNVPRAELDNKEQIAVPNIVLMTTNNPFPNHVSMYCKEAVYRRRDLLVKFALKETFTSIKEVPTEILENFGHLDVFVYSDVVNPNSKQSEPLSYEQFRHLYVEKVKEHHRREMKNKEVKYARLTKLLSEASLETLDIGNPFEALYEENFNCEIREMPSVVVEKEVMRLHELLSNQLALIRVRVADSEIFQAQGDIDENLEMRGSDESANIMFSLGSVNGPIGSDGCRQGRFDDLADLSWWKKMFVQAHAKAMNLGMVCWRCGCEASVRGSVFWCNEHSHYICFHCGTLSATPYKIEKDSNEIFLETSCPLHGSRLVVRHEGVLKDFFVNLLNVILLKPAFLITNFIQSSTQPEIQGIYKHLYFLKAFLRVILDKVAAACFQAQADDVYEDNFRTKVSTLAYNMKDLWEVPPEVLGVSGAAFLRIDNPTTSKTNVNFVCPHSLLMAGYLFREMEYFPVVEIPGIDSIPDKICKGRCALTNIRFLELIVKRAMLSPRVIDDFQQTRLVVVEKMIPRFAWTQPMKDGIERRSWVRRVVRADWWENYVFPKADKAWQFVKKLAPVVALCAVLWGASKGFDIVWGWIHGMMNFGAQTETSPTYLSKKGRFNKRKTRNPYSAQAVTENLENKLNKISANYIVIRVGDKRLTAWGIKGATFILPRHLAKRLQCFREFEIEFVNSVTRGLHVLVENCQFSDYEDRDLTAVEVRGVPVLFKDCTGFLPNRGTQFSHVSGIVLDLDNRLKKIEDVEVRLAGIRSGFSARDGKEEIFSNSVVMYEKQRPGMCGSLVCVDSHTPILAMHIAGSEAQDRGVGILLFREDFQVQGEVEELVDSNDPIHFYGEDCLISYEATIESQMIPFVPNKTKIIPSLVAPMMSPPISMPAFLTKEDTGHPFSPMHYGVRKNGMPVKQFRLRDVEVAYEIVRNLMLVGQQIRTPQVLSVDEAIMGLPNQMVDDPYVRDGDVIYYGPLPLDTSAGFPFTTPKYKAKFGLGPKKKDWVQVVYEDQYPSRCVVHPEIESIYRHQMELRKKGIRPLNVFQDCLKDERRIIEKARSEGGTRLFSMSNVVGSIVLRQYTLDLTSYLRYNRIRNGIGVGINPESMEWTVLAEALLGNSGHVFTTDFSNYGAGLSYMCGVKFSDLIVDFFENCDVTLNRQDRQVVKLLLEELMGSYHVVGNLVYSTYGGSPSGAAITVEINSFVHLMYIVIAWMLISREVRNHVRGREGHSGGLLDYLCGVCSKEQLEYASENMDVGDFRDCVVAVVYGDDGIFSICEGLQDVFNAQTINLVLADYGIGVTDSSKSSKIVPFSTLDEVTFLKRKFTPHPLMPKTLYMARMCWETIEECVKWIRKGELTPEQATVTNCNCSLMLAMGWGQEKFNEWKIVLNKVLKQVNLRPIELQWLDICYQAFPELTIEYL